VSWFDLLPLWIEGLQTYVQILALKFGLISKQDFRGHWLTYLRIQRKEQSFQKPNSMKIIGVLLCENTFSVQIFNKLVICRLSLLASAFPEEMIQKKVIG